MLVNVIDDRKRRYRFEKINAVIEAAWHDNSCPDSDFVEPDDGPSYDQKEHITLQEAIAWANSFASPVTLYIYDQDGGIYPLSQEQANEYCKDYDLKTGWKRNANDGRRNPGGFKASNQTDRGGT